VTSYEPTDAQEAADAGPGAYDAVVLAGGAARRLGGADKPGLRVGGRALLDRVLTACADARTTVVVADPRPTARPVLWARADPPGGGPLAALGAGLHRTTAEHVVVLSADLPFLGAATVGRLLAALHTSTADGVLLTDAEGLGYGTRALRDKGQAAYDELAADMTRRAQELRGTDDFIAVVKTFNDDHPATPEAMLALYREATDAARAFCVEHELVTMPDGEHCEVVPSAPFSRAMLAVAHYMAPPPFAPAGTTTGVGHFFVPYPPDGATQEQVDARLSTNNNHGAWSIAVHEAYPGHHWHLAWLSWNASQGRARPLRFVLGSAYFVEGWGLYTEDLLREKGFFRTPEQELCQRDYRLFRAARIIVDTSLHLGEMTIEEATDFMATRTSLSRETAAAEVLRYCAWPTQASSYLTGAMEIARMRERWESEERGSLREFHDLAGGSGRMPIGLVERTLFG